MFLYFSDWSAFLNSLNKKGIPHGGKIIKVYASEKDPRILLGRSGIKVLESNCSPFLDDEEFSYAGRRNFTGKELEDDLSSRGLTEESMRCTRALFRFANLKETQFCQYAMSIKKDGRWIFDHPFQELDCLDVAKFPGHAKDIHIDLFSENSLTKLREIIDIDDPTLLVESGREILKLLRPEREGLSEGRPSRIELR